MSNNTNTSSTSTSTSTITTKPKMTETAPSGGLPAPPKYHNASWTLVSQGAEARIWYIPSFLTTTTTTTCTSAEETNLPAICKERFPKSYRHPALDVALTKSRTKGEARSLVRCRRGGVSTPAVLGMDIRTVVATDGGDDCAAVPKESEGATLEGESGGLGSSSSSLSACLFLEYVDGCTVREYFEECSYYVEEISGDGTTAVSDDGEEEGGPEKKRSRQEVERQQEERQPQNQEQKQKRTMINEQTKMVAYEMGVMIAKMHNTKIIHGDLTTSNIMMRGKPPPQQQQQASSNDGDARPLGTTKWKPNLVLIDFGLSSNSGNSAEEKAVDLYVLERAFATTHAGSEPLVEEMLRAYKSKCKTSDSVLHRLSLVRLRGRKRECFG